MFEPAVHVDTRIEFMSMNKINEYICKKETEIKKVVFINIDLFNELEKKIDEIKWKLMNNHVINDIQKKEDNTNEVSKESLLFRIDEIAKNFIQPISEKLTQKKPIDISKIGTTFKRIIPKPIMGIITNAMSFFSNTNTLNDNDDINKKFFSDENLDVWRIILSSISIGDRRNLAQVSPFFRNLINKYPIPKEGYVLVKYKNESRIINLAVFHAKQNETQLTEEDLYKACKK